MSNNSRVGASDSYGRYQGWWRSTTGGGQRRRLLFCLCSCVSSFVRVSVRLGVHFSCARACAFARCRSACPSACSRQAKAGATRPQRSGCPCAGGTSGMLACMSFVSACSRVHWLPISVCARRASVCNDAPMFASPCHILKGLAHIGQMRRARLRVYCLPSRVPAGVSAPICANARVVGACARVLRRGCFPLPRTLTVRVLARSHMFVRLCECMPRLRAGWRAKSGRKMWTGSVGLRLGPRRYISKKACLPRSLQQRPLRSEAGARRGMLLYSVRHDRE